MRYLLLSITFICSITVLGQSEHQREIEKFQEELNEEFLNPEESPLSEEERAKFTRHKYFPIDANFRVVAKFTKLEKPKTFKMKTTTDRRPTYDKYGIVQFTLNGVPYELTIYQSHYLRSTEEYKNYLFLPFTDNTNGEETYGGGRYIDLNIPDGDEIVIDFNKAYCPSCAYNHKYSCPIPPKENSMDVRIEAGVMNLVY